MLLIYVQLEHLTNKLKFISREWKLERKIGVDFFDLSCSNIDIDCYQNIIMRILPNYNLYFNENWITDKIRFGYDSLFLNLYKEIFTLDLLFSNFKLNNLKF